MRIGEEVLDIIKALDADLFSGDARLAASACRGGVLNGLSALSPHHWSELRRALFDLLRGDDKRALVADALVPLSSVQLHLPFEIKNYTDFYASIDHATNIGRLIRPDNPLLPNYRYVPIGYHGRASSVHVTPSSVIRPMGQRKGPQEEFPSFGPCRFMDYEIELGVFIGGGNQLGERVSISKAESMLFGFCLVNDWSARDIQAWEYQPLGPFLAKSFATTISPYVVTAEALLPFRSELSRGEGEPSPLPYLDSPYNREQGALDLEVQVHLRTKKMKEMNLDPHCVSVGNAKNLYWSFAQFVTHHTSNGCNLMPGDLLASGTISGPTPDSWGSMMELTKRGESPIELPTSETRRSLEDFDEVIMRGAARREGHVTVSLGECRGVVAPAME